MTSPSVDNSNWTSGVDDDDGGHGDSNDYDDDQLNRLKSKANGKTTGMDQTSQVPRPMLVGESDYDQTW